MTTPGTRLGIREIGETILSGVQDHFAAAAQLLPERQYVAPGDPSQIAWDCEQLVVSLQGIGWGQHPSAGTVPAKIGGQTSAVAVRHAIFVVALVRCTPSVGARNTGVVPADQIQAAGLEFLTDAGVLSQALVVACARVRAGLDRADLVEVGAVNPEGPSGGFHGMSAQIAITSGTLV